MSADVPAAGGPTTPFHDLNDFVAIPRVTALQLSPNGSWLAAAVQTLSADQKKYLTSIWRIDTAGGPARRLTRSAEGEANPRFLPDGSLLFTSKRPDPGAAPADKADKKGSSADGAALWLLPPDGGEARVVAVLPGGITAAEAARDTGAIVLARRSSPRPRPGGTGGRAVPPGGWGDGSPPSRGGLGGSPPGQHCSDDARLRKERGDAGVTAILHESAPIRYWDHDLGPEQVRLFWLDPGRLREADGSPQPAGPGRARGSHRTA